jgi:hypothetical protein
MRWKDRQKRSVQSIIGATESVRGGSTVSLTALSPVSLRTAASSMLDGLNHAIKITDWIRDLLFCAHALSNGVCVNEWTLA